MKWIFTNAQSTHRVAVHRQSDHFTVRIGKDSHCAKVLHYQAPCLTLLIDDHRIVESDVEWKGGACHITLENVPYDFQVSSNIHGASAGQSATAHAHIRAPLPGRIVDVLVHAGDPVRTGQPVCIIEAMKMQNEICAGRDGVVATIAIQRGAAVEGNALLMTLE